MSNWLNQINFPLPKEALHRPTEIFIFFNEIYLSQGAAAAEKMSMEILAHSHLTLACNPFKRLIQFTTPSICSQHPEKKQHCSTHIFDFSPPRAVEEVFPTFFPFSQHPILSSHTRGKKSCVSNPFEYEKWKWDWIYWQSHSHLERMALNTLNLSSSLRVEAQSNVAHRPNHHHHSTSSPPHTTPSRWRRNFISFDQHNGSGWEWGRQKTVFVVLPSSDHTHHQHHAYREPA